VKIRVTVVEEDDDPLRSPPGFVKHGTAYVVDQYSVVSGLAAAVKWWGFVAFRVSIEPLIGRVKH
jgi:hypothetical protein